MVLATPQTVNAEPPNWGLKHCPILPSNEHLHFTPNHGEFLDLDYSYTILTKLIGIGSLTSNIPTSDSPSSSSSSSPNYIGSDTWIVFCHSSLSYTKSSDNLQLFWSIYPCPLWGAPFSWGASTFIENFLFGSVRLILMELLGFPNNAAFPPLIEIMINRGAL